jgi:single-strand DNA-binding protein
VDRDATTKGDRRLVAHLAADEPVDNAAIVSLRYIDDVRDRRVVCRALTPRDARTVPLAEEEQVQLSAATLLADREPSDQRGYRYRLDRVQTGMSIPELRWQRHGTPAPACNAIVSVREAVAALESYEPVRGLSIRALALHDCDPEVSTTVLRAELTRVQNSPIVLNRCLREAVLASTDRQQLSMSEIALRCGRVKRDSDGEYTERPNYFDVSVYGAPGENVGTYMHKGSRVAIDGRLDWREWETTDQQKRQAVSIVADTVQFLDSPGERTADEGDLVGVGAGDDGEDSVF